MNEWLEVWRLCFKIEELLGALAARLSIQGFRFELARKGSRMHTVMVLHNHAVVTRRSFEGTWAYPGTYNDFRQWAME